MKTDLTIAEDIVFDMIPDVDWDEAKQALYNELQWLYPEETIETEQFDAMLDAILERLKGDWLQDELEEYADWMAIQRDPEKFYGGQI